MPPASKKPSTRAELLELYKVAVEEYRFQVRLNWDRTQYYFILNVAIGAGAISLRSFSDKSSLGTPLAGVIFTVGILTCGLCAIAGVVQQTYYESARAQKRKLEDALGLDDHAIKTTPGQGSTLRRIGRVTTVNYILLGALALVNAFGAGLSFVQYDSSSPSTTTTTTTTTVAPGPAAPVTVTSMPTTG